VLWQNKLILIEKHQLCLMSSKLFLTISRANVYRTISAVKRHFILL